MTSARMANAIMQDTSFKGYHILVEGVQDVKLFKRLFLENNARLSITHGKHNMRDVYEILTTRNFDKKIGVRDADFLRIKNNGKYNKNFSLAIFPTDYHDAEGMVINSPAMMHFLEVISTKDKINNFEKSNGPIIDLIYNLSYPLACLRLANKRFELGLSFKPKERDGNKIKFKKFICDKKANYLGDESLVNTVHEYSKNRGSQVSAQAYILEKLAEVKAENHSIKEIVNGHDIAEILFIVCKKYLNSQHKALVNADCVEDMMFLAYESSYFKSSNLFSLINTWECGTNCKVTV